jgi:alkylation response protein AidB-like acyl-CoA dehydrogenase
VSARQLLRQDVTDFLAHHDPRATPALDWLRERYDAGLAWVHFPVGLGGRGLPRPLQVEADKLFEASGAHDNRHEANTIGLGMAAPTILAFGTPSQQQRFLRPLWTGEEIWCQLFSEPGAGSDLAALATRARRSSGGWVVNGQKVWTSGAHNAQWAILVARTDPDVTKHAGLTYFLCPMTAPGIEVRPLRQCTGEAEFNEVFLTDVHLSDEWRLGEEGEGWRIATATLSNERVAIGDGPAQREDGMIGLVAQTWRGYPERRTHDLHQRLLTLWVEAEVARLASTRMTQKLAAGQPGPEGAAMKLTFARISQALSGLDVELGGAEGLRYDDWTMTRPDGVHFLGRGAGYRYLRAKGNSIEGGTSEILRNVLAERVFGLPPEPRVDRDLPWKELAR